MHVHSDHRWGIVLAAGEGVRMRQFVLERTGRDVPKQFAALTGTRSLLRHTLDRIERLLKVRNLVITVMDQHTELARGQLTRKEQEQLLHVPANRDTAPNILLSALRIRAEDPEATIVLIPSDHFILEEDRFLAYLDATFSYSTVHPDLGVLLGIIPDRPEPDYGWIEAGRDFERHDDCRFHRIVSFREKPDPRTAETLFSQGALWNSLVLTVRAETLIALYRKSAPELFRKSVHLIPHLHESYDPGALETLYDGLPSVNFSRVVLESQATRLRVVRLEGVQWSDWGEGQRVMDGLDLIGRNLH